MINAPPDPDASLEAEQRSEDDGMPEHPQKAVDPKRWAEDTVAREKAAALGYPTHPVAQAWADLVHTTHRLVDRIRPRNQAAALSAASAIVGIGAGMAIYLLFLRDGRRR